jgi:hypothetical protein
LGSMFSPKKIGTPGGHAQDSIINRLAALPRITGDVRLVTLPSIVLTVAGQF